MIVAFSSTHHGQTGTTTNALAIAICSSLKHHLKVLLASSAYGSAKLTNYLLPKTKDDNLTSAGTNDLMRLARSGLLKPNAIANYTIPILKHSLLDVLADYSLNNNDEQDIEIFTQILKLAERSYDLVILDVGSILADTNSNKLLNAADNIVLSSNQNLDVLKAVKEIRTEQALLSDCFVCLGNYEANLKFKQRQVKKYLKTNKVFHIIHDSQLLDLMNDGNLLDYFGRYFFATKTSKSNPLINSVIASSDYLLEQLNLIKG